LSPTPTGSASPTPTPAVALTLDKNFFNPTQGQLGMDLRVDQAGQVKIMVFNIAGKEVRKLEDDTQAIGQYRRFWDGTNSNGSTVGNAVYYILIQTASGRMIRKVIVLK
jgi:flagellar hook assembly protein FlgD